MLRTDIVSFDTGEILGTVTTRYNNINTLFDNVCRWMRRHPEYDVADWDELLAKGIKWEEKVYWVKEK